MTLPTVPKMACAAAVTYVPDRNPTSRNEVSHRGVHRENDTWHLQGKGEHAAIDVRDPNGEPVNTSAVLPNRSK